MFLRGKLIVYEPILMILFLLTVVFSINNSGGTAGRESADGADHAARAQCGTSPRLAPAHRWLDCYLTRSQL